MKSNLKIVPPAAVTASAHTPAPPLAGHISPAEAMTSEKEILPAPAAVTSVQARVASPKSTAKAGTVRRMHARTGA